MAESKRIIYHPYPARISYIKKGIVIPRIPSSLQRKETVLEEKKRLGISISGYYLKMDKYTRYLGLILRLIV
jgi:hypothetical protein